MAETPLPSPVEVADYLENNPPVPKWMQTAIVAEFAAGRLVDREAMTGGLMADRVLGHLFALRDHSQPCDHGSIETHTVESSLSTVPWPGKDVRLCPGGREVTFPPGTHLIVDDHTGEVRRLERADWDDS